MCLKRTRRRYKKPHTDKHRRRRSSRRQGYGESGFESWHVRAGKAREYRLILALFIGGRYFLRQARIAEAFSECLGPKTLSRAFFQVLGWPSWSILSQLEGYRNTENPQVCSSIDRMNIKFGPKMSRSQTCKLFASKKNNMVL